MCLFSQSLVPAASNRTSAIGVQRKWGLTSPNNYHRANRSCFSLFTRLYVHFRGQKGGPVNPASSKYSSPSKVNASAEPVGQEKEEGVQVYGGETRWDLPPRLG